MSNYFIVLIAMLIDLIIPNVTIYDINNITYFTPLCTLVSLVFLYNEDKSYYRLYIITVIIYSIIYMNNLIIGIIIFGIIFFLLKIFRKLFVRNLFIILIETILAISIYDFLFMSLLSIINYMNFNINLYLYKFSHSLVINIMFGITIYAFLMEKSSKSTK